MAEIVCPHCHATVDGTFCPGCRSFIGSADRDAGPEVAEAPTERVPAAMTRATAAQDVVGEAVKASMATSRRGSWDVLEELDDDNDDPYPSDTEVLRRDDTSAPSEKTEPRRRPPRKRTSARTKEAAPPPPVLARVVAWLVAVPEKVRTGARNLGSTPVAVLVVVLALLASGGLLYAVGAFDEGTKKQERPAAARVLTPASYKASCAASPSTTSAGTKVTFGADHLVDGKTSTAWRCAGDGGKQRVTLTFRQPVEITQVALVPGWATRDKTSKANRFRENGAPTAVTWRFDNDAVQQKIGTPKPAWAERSLQPSVRSKTVTLSIDTVRKGERRAMVAISELRITGR